MIFDYFVQLFVYAWFFPFALLGRANDNNGMSNYVFDAFAPKP